jgi:hypothetical protein
MVGSTENRALHCWAMAVVGMDGFRGTEAGIAAESSQYSGMDMFRKGSAVGRARHSQEVIIDRGLPRCLYEPVLVSFLWSVEMLSRTGRIDIKPCCASCGPERYLFFGQHIPPTVGP